jgi:hypothetical protein
MRRFYLRQVAIHALAFGVTIAPALGQSGGSGSGSGGTAAATCSTAPTAITALNIERTLTLTGNNAGVFTTMTANIPANLAAAIASGALEAREQINYNPTSNTLTILGFTAQPGSPSPTPPNAIAFGSIVQSYQVNVTNIAFSCQPVPSVLMTGKVYNNFPKTPYGDISGALIAVGFGYTTDNPPKINNVVVLVPGVAGLYSAAASGTLTFSTPSVTPPGTNAGPTIVFTPGATQTTAQKQLVLDASKSTDPNGLQLSFNWTEVSGPAAAINLGNTATPLITFAGGKGDYVFQVTVTNSKGVSSTATTTITYTGR